MFTELLMTVVLMADIVSPRGPVIISEPTPTTAVVADATTEAWTAPPQTAPQWQNGFRQYRVNGVLPPYEWQWYLYGKLADRGLEWFYPYAICQIYQESNWNQWSDNGRDKGLCQFKAVYWQNTSASAGIPGADIWDVNAQLHCYAWIMSEYLRISGYDVERALSMYYLGYNGHSEEYVGHVLRWMNYLEGGP